ncbi:endoribonuclease YbeY-like isoform X4 [Anomaloglossus baeobatrachus]|uniref:endoribonuclease YbeY-like isoform X4 n=1 Tax=Anomaloglossus baeobatrachus TaxID=238106 RepID=UPI003F4FB835
MSLLIRNLQHVIPLRRAHLRKNLEINLCPGLSPNPPFPDEYNLGDIYLGVELIYHQCQEKEEDFNNVLTVTAVHGLCHLLGYTHHSPEDWKKMFEKESDVLMEINRATGSALSPLTSEHYDQE